ncbi:MAG: fibrobacter succinogenes major paralogous domain-containing protein [Rikenellaceae bacterium]|nr:fibrobacter succinogenes major paralogous domain-containing protein [Rikenellaceae bacterium]
MKTMKYLVPALMLFAGVACTKEIAAPEQDNVQEEATEQLELSASLSDVRTSLSGVKTLWSPGDEIAVRKIWNDGSTSRWYKFTAVGLTEASASAAFAGIIATRDEDVYTLEAVYPYESALASEAGAINLIIPSEQKAKAGSFGEKAAVAVGECLEVNGKALTFSNVGSAMKFKLVHDASSVVITSTSDGAPVAGKFSYSGGKLTKLSDPVSSVTVSGEMKAGETYYAIVAPGTYKISAAISGVEVKKSSAEPGIEFEANVINNLGIIADVNQIPNCYIVKPGESVDIPVYKAFAMWEESAWSDYKPSEKKPEATVVQVLWEDEQGLLTNINNNEQLPLTDESKLQEKWFTVTAAERKSGNAAVSIRFGGEHRWIVHIWVTDYDGSSYKASNGLEFMDRNLGATSTDIKNPGSYGVYYQGVRYNPFPGPGADGAMKSLSVKGSAKNISYTECWGAPQEGMCRWISKNPTVFVKAKYDKEIPGYVEPYSWLTLNEKDSDYVADFWPSKTNRKKTAYDPCPAGWMLPVYDESGNSPYSFWNSAPVEVLKENYPAAGRLKYDFTYFEVGSAAVLWCGDPTGLKTCSAFINFNNEGSYIGHNASYNHSRANALPVRCVKIK